MADSHSAVPPNTPRVAFPIENTPTAASAPVSPVHRQKSFRPAMGGRKSSNASTIAASIHSFNAVSKAPMIPSLRKSATALNPKLDIVSLGWGEHAMVSSPTYEHPPVHDQSQNHQRQYSSSTISTAMYQSDLTRRLREASQATVNSHSERKRVSSTHNLREQTSGYFDSLRHLASASSASLSQMIHADSSDAKKDHSPSEGASSFTNALKKISPNGLVGPPLARKSSLAPSLTGKNQSPLISKFITPSSHERTYKPLLESPSEEHPSASTSAAGNWSRTQQKLMMQKHAPFPTVSSIPHIHPGSSDPCTINHATLIPQQYTSLQPSTSSLHFRESKENLAEWHLNEPAEKAQHFQTLRQWAMNVVKEADRVDREHEFVRRFRDPMAESFGR